jgi:hypothetical protein
MENGGLHSKGGNYHPGHDISFAISSKRILDEGKTMRMVFSGRPSGPF